LVLALDGLVIWVVEDELLEVEFVVGAETFGTGVVAGLVTGTDDGAGAGGGTTIELSAGTGKF